MMSLTLWLCVMMLGVVQTQASSRGKRAVNADEQPKMVTNNGHLIFQTGANHNITFKTGGGNGRIVIDTFDLVEMAKMVKSNKDAITSIQQNPSVPTDLQTTLNQLTRDVQDLKSRVTALENADTIPPDLLQRVTQLETQVSSLNSGLSNNDCNNNPCRNGGTCINLYQGYQCRCTPGYQGTTCNDDVNECSIIGGTIDACQNGGTCMNTRGSYRCQCAANWNGPRCSIQWDDCSSASSQDLCLHGYCVNKPRTQSNTPRYDCICYDGWRSDPNSNNPACTIDVDECSDRNRPCSTQPLVDCINVPGTYYCGSCPTGYTGNGNTCTDVNECLQNNGGCSLAPLVQCINTIGSRNCGTCPAGYVGNGEICTYIGLCNQNNGGCSPSAICTENSGVPGGRICTCQPGYTGNGVGLNGCLQSGGGTGGGGGATTCNDNPCENGRCVSTGSNSYECECDIGWEGVNCDRETVECASNPCQNGGSCTDRENGYGYDCQCVSGYGGDNCEEELYACGAWLSGPIGEFEFPREGNPYPHGVSCAWVITIPQSDKVIEITFARFDIEEHNNCMYDFLQINDGHTAAHHPIGRYCNANPPPHGDPIRSTHDQLYFWFFSDASISGTGFKIQWRSVDPVCGGEITDQTFGSISSPGWPGVYPHSRDCFWRITVDAGLKITIAFGTLRIETHDTCDYDYLELHDGIEEDAPSLGKYCSSQLPSPVETTGPYATVRFHSDATENDQGFHITFTSDSIAPGCGGVFTDDNAIIISPNFPNAYPHDVDCIWTIQVPQESDTILLEITDLTIEEHIDCGYDYLEVRDGFDASAPFVGRYCHSDSIPPPFRSSGNTLWLKFSSDGSVSEGGFRATYATYCGGVFTEAPGEVSSPYFPDPYPNNKECEYVITAEQGLSVQLTFITFDIEGHADCAFDFLEVRDGGTSDATLISTLCGSALPQPIIGTARSLYLKFSTDGNVANHGFRASYEFIDAFPNGCGGLYTELTGLFSSPLHPDTYPHGVHCVYAIQVEPGRVIRLMFNAFNLESHSSCNYDYVAIYDNSTTSHDGDLGRYCGSTPPHTITTEGNLMTVVFHTDSSVAREGFTASYISLDASTICGGQIYSDTGIITSPNFPQNYPHNRECVWTINADAGILVQFNFTSFSLEGGNGCPFDYVEIRNGGFANSPLIGRYCGPTITPSTFVSHSNRMYVKFRTDGSVSRTGFRIVFDATATGCGGTLTTPTGSFASPNYPNPYHHNAECFWLITASEGSSIILSFADMDMEGHSSCYYDYVKIFDGPQETDPLLGTYCGITLPAPLTSSGSNMRIKMRTDYSVTGRGFHAAYVTSCNTRLTARSGVIASPNFPLPHPHNRDCLWIIETTAGNKINITFNNLALENHGSCVYDYVKIYDGETTSTTVLDTLCGSPNVDGLAYSSTDNLMAVQFHSDGSVASAGFRASYVAWGCGADFTTDSGQLNSPGYPNLYGHRRECHWTIRVSYGHSIVLTIHELDVESAHECVYDALQVYSGHDTDGLQLAQVCHTQTSPQQVSTTGNEMFIRFFTDASVNGRGFNATWQSVNGGCGGNFSTPTGNIHSHNYPNNYDHNTDCTWLITVDSTKSINITFLAFNLEASGSSCYYDYVKVYDGPNENSPLLLVDCGAGLPSPPSYFSSGNQMYIRMRADGSISRSGFNANYISVCGGRLDASQGGVITSENYPNRYPRGQNCTWIIESPNPVDRVILTFTHLDISVSDNCANDSVTVRNGNDVTAPLVDTYCGTSSPPPLISFGAAFTLQFISDQINEWNVYNKGFRVTYSTSISSCGGALTSMSGAFASPGYPDSYPTDTECVWTIPSSPGNRVQVTFSAFALQDSPGCTADYLEIRQGNSTGALIGRFCGATFPTNATTRGSMWIRFYSDSSSPGSGFLAQFGHAYGGVLTQPDNQLASPRYPINYDNNLNVLWTLESSGNNRIRATFIDFELEGVFWQSNLCFWDIVRIYDGPDTNSPELLTACGESIPDPVESTGNVMTITFITDASVVRRGFLIEWAEVPAIPTDAGCGSTLIASDTQANFSSPGYPVSYQNNLDCRWIIESPVGTTIRFNITDISIEYHYICYYDSVKVYDGLTTDMRELGSFCGRVLPPAPLYSSSNALLVVFHSDSYVNDTGFAATYQSYCGGSYNTQHGIISSPLYPSNYPANQNCTWTIQVLAGYTILVDFRRMAIQSSSGCSNDYLELRSGLSSTSPPLGNANGRYCGTSQPSRLETPSNTLRLTFISDGSGPGTAGFQLSFLAVQEGCGGHRVLSQADYGFEGYELTSQNYPQNYPPNAECVWIITAPATEAIQLDFMDPFYIEPLGGKGNEEIKPGTTTTPLPEISGGDNTTQSLNTDFTTTTAPPENVTYSEGANTTSQSPDMDSGTTRPPVNITASCQHDYLDIRDGNSENSRRLARLCGSQTPNTIISSSNAIFIKFRTDANNANKGFKLKYRIAICGGTFSGTEGQITSPNYPSNYASDSECRWYLQGPTGHYMTFTFTSFNIVTDNNNCTVGDFLEIYDGRNENATSLGRLCGSSTPFPIDTSDSFAYLRFKSDGLNTAGGFQLQYRTSIEVCGGDLVTPSGSFNSPNYPGEYAHARVCTWSITVAAGHMVTLRFTDFDIEEVDGCYYDSVQVYNGLVDDSPLIGSYCGTNPPSVIQSSGNTMRVVFTSDGSISGGGFLATYDAQDSAVCGGSKTISPGDNQEFVFSPGFSIANYSNNVQCEWVIENTAVQNTSLYLTWDPSFNVEGSAVNCLNDYVEIRSGLDMSGQLIGRYCGETVPEPISAPYRSLYIQFRSDASEQRTGFKLYYSASECGGLQSGTNGVITSPNYPGNYNHTNHCAWLIITPEGTTITLTFTDFAIETQTHCGFDRVYALNGRNLDSPQISGENPWCGQQAPQPVTSSSNQVLLVFQTDSSVSDRGFRLEWTTAQRGCGGNFHGNQGTIASDNFGSGQYDLNTECVWTITVETGYHVVLTFNSNFDVQSGDNVKVYDGSDDDSSLLGTYSGSTAPAAVTSSLNVMRVKFQSDANNQGNGFQATWSTGCGAVFNNYTLGRIVSPGFPNRDYPNSLSCDYVINWTSGKNLALRFDRRFGIEESSNCVSDGLDIFSGTTNTGTSLGRLCGSESPDVIQTDGSVFLNFHSDSTVTGSGFGLIFEEGCGGVFTGSAGIIQTPPHLETYRHNENCTWVITVSANRAIEFKFTMFDLEYGGEGCAYDFVEVLDGNDFGASSLTGRLCGTDTPQTLISTGNTLFINFVSDRSAGGRGFQAAYQEVFGPSQGCGGTLTQPSGSITSLDIDSDNQYENNLNCRYIVSVEANKVVQMTFSGTFDIETAPSGDCSYDYVEIRDGFGDFAPLLGRFCGTTAPASPILMSGNEAFVLFHSDEQTGRSGFTINYSTADRECGGVFNATDTPQTITSLNYPSAYAANKRCSWVISAPNDYTHVRIRVTAIDIQGQAQSNCNNDYLELRDYPAGEVGETLRYCGNTIPDVFDSSRHAVQVYFVSDSSIQGTGFSLQYYITDCNNNYTVDNGRLRSPGQGVHYHNGHECNMYITTANDTYISLYFNYFGLEYSSTCSFDSLQIYNGTDASSPLVSTLCGGALPDPVFANSSQLRLKFNTDQSITDTGFDITYTSSTVRGCGGNLSGREGSFTSPMYPGNYTTNLNCEWSIQVPAGGQPVSLQLTYINIDGQEGVCSNDRLEVYDGQDSTSRLFGRYCGATPPAIITTTGVGRAMFVRFVTDGITAQSNSTIGFRAKFFS
ncbi:LOW QUALITY PROTEIN: cubilin-like [Amphiura filiformis]|uniref:LOW QUALITY PROTEIN: cubilin-like n=1 Tax=Amphiura filiformis TaxID=82378 RepID=UPI003B21550F